LMLCSGSSGPSNTFRRRRDHSRVICLTFLPNIHPPRRSF
jgi:hypothetical protein